jgi:hypothetical protein
MPLIGIRGATTVTNGDEDERLEPAASAGNRDRMSSRLESSVATVRALILLHVNTEKGPHDVDYPLIHGAAARRIARVDSTPL